MKVINKGYKWIVNMKCANGVYIWRGYIEGINRERK